MPKIRLGIVGFGKIAHDQHLPAILHSSDFELCAVADPLRLRVDVRSIYSSYREMLSRERDLEAVVICTPPLRRYEIACAALAAGKHVLLEKPPTVSVAELADLRSKARSSGLTLFAAWHSVHNQAVDDAKARIAGTVVASVAVTWKENVRVTHPGQDWIWQPGGFGVFDAGINALAILCRLFPDDIHVRQGNMHIPANRHTPIAASAEFTCRAVEGGIHAEFDWQWADEQVSTIAIKSADGRLIEIADGGARLRVDGQLVAEPRSEYRDIYRRFAELIVVGVSDVDDRPLKLVNDFFAAAQSVTIPPFFVEDD
jgi:D-galactose 1-dehydrogenase